MKQRDKFIFKLLYVGIAMCVYLGRTVEVLLCLHA